MDKILIINELNKNIKDFSYINEKITMIQLAMYKKNEKELKLRKINELKEYFNNKINFYGQDILDYQKNVNDIIKEYTNEIDKLIKAYDYLYSNINNKLQKSISNQIIAIGNIVTLLSKKNTENAQKIDNNILAIAQKKVNYSVIIEECRARLNWCIENIEKDIDNIFENKFYELDIYKNSFFERIKRKILNYINGKKNAKNIIEKYKNDNLKKILDINNSEIVTIIALTKELLKQIANVENQISVQYENAFIN